ncbi:ABC transporter permease [Dyella marensis]|uniref:Duplicated orphan permease n=1 Tax=Dyella marensis TaxID=500610 RepID=A0A1I1WU27_9GAMM|nr:MULTISPECIES: ABC transporter permease [Dyella]SFD98539.1 duplicated orphan permease [Dyella marensis]
MNVWLAELWRAWRASLRRPGFLLLAAGVLALGIGACAVAFVLVEQVLLKPLPLSQPEQLMAAGKLRQGWPPRISTRQYAALQKLDGVQSIGLMAFATPTVNIMSRGMPQRAAVTYADPGLLPTLGLQPQLGRNFIAGEEDSRGAQIVMLSHDFWERQYAGDPSAIGQILKVEGTPHTIVGVLPEALSLSSYGGDIMLPADLGPDTAGDQHLYIAVVRLAAGASPAAVNAQVAARLRAEAESSGTDPAHRARFGVLGYQASLHVGGALVLVLFQAGALLVLLIAVVNEANLLFLRALALQRDTAVRSALGARHWHLASPLLAEGLLVSLFGTGLGALLAMLGIAIVRSIIPPQLTGGELHLGVQTLLLMLLVSLLVTLGSALLGIWRARAMVSFNDLREGGRSGGTQQQGRLNRVLVTAQVMLTAVLLCACGIFLQQAWKNAHLQWGFDGANVATLALAPVQADYPDVRSVSALSQRLVERMRQLPGVLGAAASTSLPVNDFFGTFGTPAHAPGNEVITVLYRAVGTDYFRLFGIRAQRGRLFSTEDRRGSEAVAIISRAMAERQYGGNALGQQVQMDDAAHPGRPWTARIVGVVDDTYPRSDRAGDPPPTELYVPLEQMPDALLASLRVNGSMQFALRVRGDVSGYAKALRELVATVAPEQPIDDVRSMRSIVEENMSGSMTGIWICGVLAAMALLLAAAGLYAVMSVAVTAREHELGVRAALGASPVRLAAAVLRGGMVQVAAGLASGLLLAAAFPRLFAASFAQLGTDVSIGPWVAGGVCAVLLTFGLLACLMPAVRAGRVQPMRVLQGD